MAEPKRRALRPVDAASLLLIDRRTDGDHVLMGRRSSRHVFMPAKFVFPGGKRDRADLSAAPASAMHPEDERRLVAEFGTTGSPKRAAGLAVAAIRETMEETGHRIARDDGSAVGVVRYVARAITPPGRSRRYDTRFFACFRKEVTEIAPPPTDELEDVRWIPLRGVQDEDVPPITGVIAQAVLGRLELDPDLRASLPVPFIRARHGRIVHDAV